MPIKLNRHMIRFSEKGTLCLIQDYLIANELVTLDILLFKVFVFLTRSQSYAPLLFHAFVPKSIHGYLKTILQNPLCSSAKKKSKFWFLTSYAIKILRWAPCHVALSQNVYKFPIVSMYIKLYIQVFMYQGSFILLWQTFMRLHKH